MKTYTVKATRGSNFEITGENLVDAIASREEELIDSATRSLSPGYSILSASLDYSPSILGAKGGFVFRAEIEHHPCVGDEDTTRRTEIVEVWIKGAKESCGVPLPHDFVIVKK